jgi:hypothetical protein
MTDHSMMCSGQHYQESGKEEEKSHWHGVKLPLGMLALAYISYRQYGYIEQREKTKMSNAANLSEVAASSMEVSGTAPRGQHPGGSTQGAAPRGQHPGGSTQGAAPRGQNPGEIWHTRSFNLSHSEELIMLNIFFLS